jgi:hypothetical protein
MISTPPHRKIEGTDFSTDQTMQQAISFVISKIENLLIVIFIIRVTDWEYTQIDSYIGFFAIEKYN